MGRGAVAVLLAAQIGVAVSAQAPLAKRVNARVGVPMGVLVIDGGVADGAEVSEAVARRFVELAGGAAAKIVLIPTAGGDASARNPSMLAAYRRLFGSPCCTILHTMNREAADRDDFAAPLKDATGAWLTGGSPAVLSDVYWHTATERALRAVLDRGGVVGGSSAGALVHGSRIHTPHPNNAFAFLRNTVIWPHLNRPGVKDMLVVEIMANPQWIGVGVSEQTAAIVRGDDLEVVGGGEVVVVDGKKHGGTPYLVLRAGDRVTLRPR